ncbi:MAG: ThiF family adenylyltransferase [Pseudomonadota bacterium]
MSRYARQTILPEIGDVGQLKLSTARILVVGAGGLGTPVLQYLAGAGVGAMTIMDPDVVEVGNLHRQPLFGHHDLGQPKVVAAARRIADLNPDVDVTALPALLTPGNAPGLVADHDLVLDCADSFAATYTLSDTCLDLGKPLFSASALGLEGYVGGFCGGAPSLRAVFPDLPRTLATCATAGVLGPVVGMIGAVQAQMALAHLLGLTPSPLGTLTRVDARSLRNSTMRFDGAEEPARAHRFIAPDGIRADDVIFDLRPETEAPTPAHPAAQRALPDAFARQDIRPEGPRAVLCCRSGLRSWTAARHLSAYWPGEIVLVADPMADQPERTQ